MIIDFLNEKFPKSIPENRKKQKQNNIKHYTLSYLNPKILKQIDFELHMKLMNERVFLFYEASNLPPFEHLADEIHGYGTDVDHYSTLQRREFLLPVTNL